MSDAPSTPAEMQAFILEQLSGRNDDSSDLGMLCDIVGKKLTNSLVEHIPEMLVDVIEARMLDWTAQSICDVTEKIAEDGLLLVIGTEDEDPVGYLSADANAATILIGAQLGADHEGELSVLTGPLSPIEMGILKLGGQPFATAMKDTQLAKSQCDVVDIRERSDIAQADIKDCEVVSFRFELTFGRTVGSVGLHIRKTFLTQTEEPVVAENDNVTRWNESLRDGIMQMNVGVKAIVKLDATTLGDLNSLMVGDIIELPSDNPHTAMLTARDKTLFIGQFGRIGNRYSVRVEQSNHRSVDLVEHIMSTM